MSDSVESGQLIENTSESGGSFRLLERLGRGGFADVHRAVRTTRDGLENVVAVKLLRSDLHPGVRAEDRLRREADIQFRLNHPVICKALQLVVLDGRPGLVTEYIEGRDLRRCIEDGIPSGPLLEVVQRVALALSYAHREHGVVHRDVTASNIRIGRYDGSVKLLDFGIAWSELAEKRYTIAGHVTGALHALAPERLLRPDEAPSSASDVFSLGCLLFRGYHHDEFLNIERHVLFQQHADEAISNAFTERRLSALSADTPTGVVELLRAMLQWDPNVRPSADDVARHIGELVETLDGQPSLIKWNRQQSFDQTPDAGAVGSSGVAKTAHTAQTSTMMTTVVAVPLGLAGVAAVAAIAMLLVPIYETSGGMPDCSAASLQARDAACLERRGTQAEWTRACNEMRQIHADGLCGMPKAPEKAGIYLRVILDHAN